MNACTCVALPRPLAAKVITYSYVCLTGSFATRESSYEVCGTLDSSKGTLLSREHRSSRDTHGFDGRGPLAAVRLKDFNGGWRVSQRDHFHMLILSNAPANI